MKHTFNKEEGGWFIDLPQYLEAGGDKVDLQMVAGADTMLDLLSDYGSSITLDISLENCPHQLILVLGEDMGLEGADYVATYKSQDFPVWLCAVTLYVFGGEYPGVIYINIVEK